MATSLTINGTKHDLDVPGDMPLLWVIRDIVGLTGTKFGCGIAQCGACTVHIGGEPVRSCITAVSDVQGPVITIEGLDPNGEHPVQKAWRDAKVPQCGYCQSGQIMTAAAFISKTKNPTEQQVADAMSGNICRCGCYQRINTAVLASAGGV